MIKKSAISSMLIIGLGILFGRNFWPFLILASLFWIIIVKILYRRYWVHRQRIYLKTPTDTLYVDNNGYFRIASTNKLLHRVIAYQHHYKPNMAKYPKGFHAYVVHHRDQNKWHNDPANLVILDPKEHAYLHGKY